MDNSWKHTSQNRWLAISNPITCRQKWMGRYDILDLQSRSRDWERGNRMPIIIKNEQKPYFSSNCCICNSATERGVGLYSAYCAHCRATSGGRRHGYFMKKFHQLFFTSFSFSRMGKTKFILALPQREKVDEMNDNENLPNGTYVCTTRSGDWVRGSRMRFFTKAQPRTDTEFFVKRH